MGKILLQDIEFYAYHGVIPEEQKIGGRYLVDLELETDLSVSSVNDELSSTIDYAVVYDVVKKEMDISSKLIENVAGRVAKSLLYKFENLNAVQVKVTKMNPPVHGQVKSVAVIMEERRK